MLLIVGCQREQEEYVSLRKQRLEAEAAKAEQVETNPVQAPEEPRVVTEEELEAEETTENVVTEELVDPKDSNREEDEEDTEEGEEEEQLPKGQVVREVINLRKGPTTRSNILDKMRYGTEVTILSEIQVGDLEWILVEGEGQQGKPLVGYVQKYSVLKE